MRSKLLGLPTSIALASVRTDGRGANRPVERYAGTTSLALVAAMKRSIARPDRFAINPAVRLPKFPLGVENTTPLSAPPPCVGAELARPVGDAPPVSDAIA